MEGRKGKKGGLWVAFIAILCWLLIMAGAAAGDVWKPISSTKTALAAEAESPAAIIGEDTEAKTESEAAIDTEAEAIKPAEERRAILPGYEDTVWGVTAPDGSAVSDYTWEMYDASVQERKKNGIRVRINGFDVDFPDQKPVMEQGRILVPMRSVFEHVCVQCRVSWDQQAGQAIVFDQRGRRVIFQPGEYSYTVVYSDGRERIYPLDAPAAIVNGRVLLPLRALLETFDYIVQWYAYEEMADIQDTYPGWRRLMKPDEWKRAQEGDCAPAALIKGAT